MTVAIAATQEIFAKSLRPLTTLSCVSLRYKQEL